MVTVNEILMGYPYIGFFQFGELPRENYDRYRMFYVHRMVFKGTAFYIYSN